MNLPVLFLFQKYAVATLRGTNKRSIKSLYKAYRKTTSGKFHLAGYGVVFSHSRGRRKSAYIQIAYNGSAADRSISLKIDKKFDHATADILKTFKIEGLRSQRDVAYQN